MIESGRAVTVLVAHWVLELLVHLLNHALHALQLRHDGVLPEICPSSQHARNLWGKGEGTHRSKDDHHSDVTIPVSCLDTHVVVPYNDSSNIDSSLMRSTSALWGKGNNHVQKLKHYLC